MADSTRTTYDEVLYPSHTHSQTHPDRLATIATLFGMRPAPVDGCRVLELGCGNGGNLIPMAFGLPTSEFVGIDLAARPLAQGQAAVEALGLKNLSLRQGNILEVSADAGPFDYIIAHGIYSWVPPAVREKILAICRGHLAPQGVAFVSYNAYPGSHLRDMVRQMMLFHVRGFSDPQERVNQAVALTKFLAESQTNPDVYRQFMKDALEEILEHEEGHLFHDELAEINAPIYFHQFYQHARRHDLQYLGEADYFEMQNHQFTPEVCQALEQLSNSRIAREQYLDFLKCRRFRQSLLCHAEVPLDLTSKPELLTRFQFSSVARPVSQAPDIHSATIEQFQGKKAASMETDFPLAKAAMLILGEVWPQALQFSELVARSRARLGVRGPLGEAKDDPEARALCEILLKSYGTGMVEVHTHAPPYATQVSQRPVASPLARWQVQQGDFVTSQFHISIKVEDEIGRYLLSWLDGTLDRKGIMNKLWRLLESKNALVIPDGDETTARREVEQQLERNLWKLARLGLLVG